MNVNSHLQPQLDAFARLANPGFALLVDAPWGAGKTHELRGWLSDRNDTLYVSVYGAKNSSTIEEALFQALLERNDVKPPQGVTKMLEGVAEKFTGAKVDLTGMYRRLVMKNLPLVLVFDDLERTEMPLSELFSAINRFVEHEKRNVLLLASQAELRNKDIFTYDRTKEKVIGRVITIVPDVEAAIADFLSSMKNNDSQLAALKFFLSEKEIISTVFETSQSSNLRLLKYAMLEFARVYDKIPDEIRENQDGMKYLVATFIALSIAFHGGDGLGIEGLDQEAGWARAVWGVNGKKEKEPPKSTLEVLQERFGEHPYVRLHGQVISAELAKLWIGKGHVADPFLSSELRASAVFRTQDSEAWQTLWWWPKRPYAEVEAALETVKKQLENYDFLEPEIIMHLTGIMLSLADEEIGWASRVEVEQQMSAYISGLEKEDLLPTTMPKRRWGGVRFDHGAFGLGFNKYESSEFLAIRKFLLEAMDRSFWKENPKRVNDLLGLAKTDAGTFIEIIDNAGRRDGIPNYANEPIFVDADPVEAAQLFFSLKPEETNEVLSPFERRVSRLESTADAESLEPRSERNWLLQVKNAAQDLASDATPIRAAQIRMVIKWNLDFLSNFSEDVYNYKDD